MIIVPSSAYLDLSFRQSVSCSRPRTLETTREEKKALCLVPPTPPPQRSANRPAAFVRIRDMLPI